MKNLVFKKKPVRKLVNQYISLYIIEEVVFTNIVKIRLPALMRIHLVMNVSQVVKEQKREEVKPIEVNEVKE